jgi:hypothetical protein
MSSRIRAGAIGCVAALVCAWYVLGAIQAIDTNRATALLSAGSIGPRKAAEVRSLLDTAGTLNPDQRVNVLRGQLAAKQGHIVRARQIFSSVTRTEPQNLQAWLQLAYHPRSTSDFLRALSRIDQLLPPVPQPRR